MRASASSASRSTSSPIHSVSSGVAFVLGICDGFDQFCITKGTAAVFRRTAAAHLDQARIQHAGFRIGEAFDLDGVLPSVAEVVEIEQFLGADVFEEVVEASFSCIKEITNPIRIGIGRTEADITGADFIEVAVGPAHGGLDSQMQAVKPDVERHLDSAQNCRADAVEGDRKPGDSGGTHAAILQCSPVMAQFQDKSSSSLWMA